MRFLSIYKPSRKVFLLHKLIEEGIKAGWLLATEGCLPSPGARVCG
jgi:hypothetical protein